MLTTELGPDWTRWRELTGHSIDNAMVRYFIQSAAHPVLRPLKERIPISNLQKTPLIMPTPTHGLQFWRGEGQDS